MSPNVETLVPVRHRSVGFLERHDETWACFLATFQARDLRWRGYFSFRPAGGEPDEEEIRTADIFLEASEEEIDRKARELGRPLLNALLASALHTHQQGRDGSSPRLRRWFRDLLSENSREIADGWENPGIERERGPALTRARSLYESYRLDQVVHFICLVHPEAFERTVERILDGRSFEFGAKDRLQFAMMVVEYIEDHLPLPPFEVWVEDYLEHPDEYRLYAHTLHRERRLP